MTVGRQYILWLADKNPPDVVNAGRALCPTGDDSRAEILADQSWIYGKLVKALAKNCPALVQRVSPTAENAGTNLWNQVLDVYQNSASIAKARTKACCMACQLLSKT
jgi:hypothetical protein